MERILKILKVKLENLKNEEWFQIMTQFKTSVREIGAETLKIVEMFEKFLLLYNDADKALELVRKSLITDELVVLDRKRDEIYRSLRRQIESYLTYFDETKRMAAKELELVIKQYGNVTTDNYNMETAEIYNLLADLRVKYVTESTALGLSQWITELDKANKAFENRYQERDTKILANEVEVKMYQVRKEMDARYRRIVYRLDALMEVENTPVFEEFIKDWNLNVQKYIDLLAQREGRKDDKTEKD